MNLIWNKVEVDNTKNRLLKFQNKSLIPESKVFVKISTSKPNTDEGAHVIVSRQILNQTVVASETIWFAESEGGVFTYSSVEIPKLENYNIPTSHESIHLVDAPVSVNVPEGATITFQNLTDSNVGVKLGTSGTGSFILSQYQLFAESFPKDDVVTFLPATTGKPSTVTYSITQSAIVTQLSNSAKAELNELKAAVDLLTQNAVTRDELESIEARLYHNTWSQANFIQRSNTKVVFSNPFIANTNLYHSRQIQDGYEFNIIFDLSVTYAKDTVMTTQRGTIYIKGIYKPQGTGTAIVSTCSNLELARLVEQITLNVSKDKNEIKYGVNLYETALTASLTTLTKVEHNFYDVKETEISNTEYITAYSVDLVNAGVVVSGTIDSILNNALKLKDLPITKLKYKIVGITSEANDAQGSISNEKLFALENGASFRIKEVDKNIEFVTQVANEKLGTDVKVLTGFKVYTVTQYKFTVNLIYSSSFGSVRIVDTLKEMVTRTNRHLDNNSYIITKIPTIEVGDTIELSFREEV